MPTRISFYLPITVHSRTYGGCIKRINRVVNKYIGFVKHITPVLSLLDNNSKPKFFARIYLSAELIGSSKIKLDFKHTKKSL